MPRETAGGHQKPQEAVKSSFCSSLESVRCSGYTAISSIWVTNFNLAPSWSQVAAKALLGHSRWPTVSQNIVSESLKTFIMLYDVCRRCIVVLSLT